MLQSVVGCGRDGCHVPHLESVLALVALQHLVGVYAHCQLLASVSPGRMWLCVQSRKGLTDTSTCPMYVCASCQSVCQCGAACAGGVGASGATHVYLAILKALLQVLVDGLVGDLADQRQVGDADLLLLGRLEDGLCCELGLGSCPGGGLAAYGLARCAVGFPLHRTCISWEALCRAGLAWYHG